MIGKICERGPNFLSWIRFSGKGLALLVEGAETCSALKVGEHFRKSWVGGRRRYMLELCSNIVVGGICVCVYLLCSFWDVEGKRGFGS